MTRKAARVPKERHDLLRERAIVLGCDAAFQCDVDALTEQNLTVLGLALTPRSRTWPGAVARIIRKPRRGNASPRPSIEAIERRPEIVA